MLLDSDKKLRRSSSLIFLFLILIWVGFLRGVHFEVGGEEIRKLEIPLSDFGPISGDWVYLEIPNLARIPLMKCY